MPRIKVAVVDADIARSAGESVHPVSSTSRKVMQVLLSSDNAAVAFCPKLKDEWSKHSSKFSKIWLSSMIARRKIIRVSPALVVGDEIDSSHLNQAKKKIAQKDAHLVDLALHSNCVIASNDNIAREVFSELSLSSGVIRNTFWVSPASDSIKLCDYLSRNSDLERTFKLYI